MSDIQVLDLTFEPFIKEQEIEDRIKILASQINEDYKEKNPLFLGILNGCFIFASDLYKNINVASEISFVKLASYEGTTSTGNVITAIGLDKNLSGRHLVIIEDIIDTGRTLYEFIAQLKLQNIASIEIVTLLDKREARKFEVEIKYCGFEIENKFVVGYGLDYDGYGRNLKEIYKLKN